MTTDNAALKRIIQAQTSLREALDLWNGADLTSVENSNELLEQSVFHMREFRDAVALGTVTPTPQMRSTVVDLRNQIRRLTRVVDASSAFVQGLAVYAGMRASTYNASGRIEDVNLLSMRES